MPRARNLKPGFFSNEDLAECTPWARLCFAGLWTLADREGRLEDRPKRIKGELFRFDTVDVEPLLGELERFGFVVRYQIDGERFIQVSKFLEHQTPHYSEKPSVIKPAPLQESDGHDDPPKTKNTPRVEPPLRGGRNPLNPDSLNPESGEKTARKRATPTLAGADVLVAAGFDAQTAADFIAHKAGVKAPLTERAWADHCREAAKAGWSPLQAAEKVMAKGWKGFEAKYVAGESPAASRRPDSGGVTDLFRRGAA